MSELPEFDNWQSSGEGWVIADCEGGVHHSIRNLRCFAQPGAKQMNDHELLLAIQELMDGVEWNADTLDEIGKLMDDNGYRLRNLED